jgi:predicted transport protein
MGKLDKKVLRLQERIKYLEDEMTKNLTQKTSNTREISVGDYQRKIRDLKLELNLLK